MRQRRGLTDRYEHLPAADFNHHRCATNRQRDCDQHCQAGAADGDADRYSH